MACLALRNEGQRNVTAVYKYISGVNSREAEELSKLKDKIGRRANGHTLVTKKFKLELRRFLTIR